MSVYLYAILVRHISICIRFELGNCIVSLVMLKHVKTDVTYSINRLSEEVIVYTSMTHTKIVAVRATLVGFLSRKQASWDNSRQNEVQIFEIRKKLSEQEQKTALSLYFRADFNNLPTILTRIVSGFRISIQNRNLTSAVRLASFSKYGNKNLLLLDQFSSDFNDSHVNLTKIVSQSHTCFRNMNRTSVARTATSFVGVIEFPRHRAVTRSLCLKGQCWDFLLLFFHESVFPKPQRLPLGPFQSFPKICGDLQVKVHHRYQRHQRQICHQYTQGLGGTDSWKKNKSRKSCDTVPLNMIKHM